MITSVKSSSQVSLEEFLRLPETKPASEYINGQIYQKPMAGGKHSMIQGHLPSKIDNQLAFAFIELTCTFGGGAEYPNRFAVVRQGNIWLVVFIIFFYY